MPGKSAQTRGPIERRKKLSEQEFIDKYLSRNRPVLVEDGIRDWSALKLWTPESFRDYFGAIEVKLQGEFFDAVAKMKFRDFIDRIPGYEKAVKADGSITKVPPYLRYSEPGQGINFSTVAFTMIRGSWSRPYFLPSNGYLHPLDLFKSDPATRMYPEWGVYVSPRGAVTRLHVDGDRSNAVLCQVHGRKRAFLFDPDDEDELPEDWHDLKLKNPNLKKIPSYGKARPYEGVLEPGQALFIPRGWFHEVYTLSTSISLTYNFIHLSEGFRAFKNRERWVIDELVEWAEEKSGEVRASITRSLGGKPKRKR